MSTITSSKIATTISYKLTRTNFLMAQMTGLVDTVANIGHPMTDEEVIGYILAVSKFITISRIYLTRLAWSIWVAWHHAYWID
uniref:Uncharacterized protein n=1 Tax=Lactuca sativa TaxID=4236 RepID=A0A9R1X4G1_LACSA|nr:hypothetical protein LSAT_V11C700370990 [Lactuca sativa]